MKKIDRTNIRNVMKLLKEGGSLYLAGKNIIQIEHNKFKIAYVYNGKNELIKRSRKWVINFIKKDYLEHPLCVA